MTDAGKCTRKHVNRGLVQQEGPTTTSVEISSEEEGYMSPYCCSSDEEQELCSQHLRDLLDEMPVFSTQSLSPSGRSLSPIDQDNSPPRSRDSSCASSAFETPYDSPSTLLLGKDYVTLEEIHARIGVTPPDSAERSRSKVNLETIFEDKFLETPPKKEFETRTNQSLLRRSLRNRTNNSGGLMFGNPPGGGDAVADNVCNETSGPCPEGQIDGLAGQLQQKCRLSLD